MVFSKSSERFCWVCSLRSRKHFLLAGTDKLGIFAGGGASSSSQLKTVVVDSLVSISFPIQIELACKSLLQLVSLNNIELGCYFGHKSTDVRNFVECCFDFTNCRPNIFLGKYHFNSNLRKILNNYILCQMFLH